MDAIENTDLSNGGAGDPDRPVRQVRWGSLLWLAAGLLCGIVFFVAASVGLVIIPVVVPLVVFVFVLVEVGAEGRAAGVVGLFIAADLFVAALLLDPPCAAPFLRQAPTGEFISGCNETQSVAGLALSAGLGNVLVIALAWALVKRRRIDDHEPREPDLETGKGAPIP